MFDLLTKPDPELTDERADEVKERRAQADGRTSQDRLVLDWRRKAETREAARVLVKDVLDELPDAYDPEIWERKTEIVFNHIFASYYDDGSSVYEEDAPVEPAAVVPTRPPTAATDVAAQHRRRRDHAGRTRADQDRPRTSPSWSPNSCKGKDAFFAVPSAELIASDETYEVEFKSTARWNLREERKDKRMEDAVVKTIAGFLNTDGGTLFIGVDDDRRSRSASTTTCRSSSRRTSMASSTG